MNKRILIILVMLLSVVVVFGIASPTAAEIKAVSAFYVLDDVAHTYQNSNVNVFMGGYPDGETHVIHELGLDNDLYNRATGDVAVPCDEVDALLGTSAYRQPCPAGGPVPSGSNGAYAGVVQLAISHLKPTASQTATLFIQSEDWTLIDCDLDDDGDFDGADLAVDTLNWTPGAQGINTNPIEPLTAWTNGDPNTAANLVFRILSVDAVEDCSNNTCAKELRTTIFIDLDTTGNNILDQADGLPHPVSPQLKTGGVCFFARIYPDLYEQGDPVWPNPGQARFDAGGGDKTVNIQVSGPSAITLEQLVAQSPGGIHPFVWLTIVVLLTGIAFVLIRESRQQTREILLRKNE